MGAGRLPSFALEFQNMALDALQTLEGFLLCKAVSKSSSGGLPVSRAEPDDREPLDLHLPSLSLFLCAVLSQKNLP